MSRVIPGILLAGGWLLLLFFGPALLFWLVITLGAAIGLHEYFRMSRATLQGGLLSAVIFICLLPLLLAYSGRSDMVLAGLVCTLLGLAVVGLKQFPHRDDTLGLVTSSVFASVYVAFCTAHLVLLRYHPQGTFWLIVLMATVAGSDTGAYYAGRAFGRRKLFPQISPKKTVAGGVGGLIAGVIAALGMNVVLSGTVSSLLLIPAAAVLVIVGIAGDLLESMIKRAVGIKDSGTLLRGHGGILDRADSILFAAPVLYLLLHFGLLR
jgi:phosphatidate cytidylyltransferase